MNNESSTQQDYDSAYSNAIEHMEAIFNRLCIKEKLGENCKECPFMYEVEKIRTLLRNKQFEQLEKKIGYVLLLE